MNPEHNLDYLAAQHAQAIVQSLKADPKKAENTLTKTLGVLQENGVYACFLYLYAREGETGESIVAKMLELFKSLQFPETPNASKKDEVLKYVAEKITADPPRLLLAKEALEQMLIYARYSAKAAQ
ncbi:MAG: hypothetical protein DDG60_09580 [Anaerolineae bacterium]|nr:MAG: hypothetical protein DDG60_09580 [Anaerolineae bacterium]